MSIFCEDTVFVSSQTSQNDVFREVYDILLKKKLVTVDFLDHLIEREENYPTGLDLTLIDQALPNIAIPHTESEYVNTTRIIPIKLNHPISFNNMIQPKTELKVSFLFMILNKDGETQSNLLATIMDFINALDQSTLLHFFQLNDPKEIYTFLTKNFKGERLND